MGYVGDVDADFIVAIGKFFERNGIVEILGVGRINGEGESVAEIFAVFELVFLFKLLLPRLGLLLDFGREVHFETAFKHDANHLCIVFAGNSDDADYFAHGTLRGVLPFGNPCLDFVALLGIQSLARRDEDIPVHPLVVRHDERAGIVLLENADEFHLVSLDDFHHLGLLPALKLRACNLNLHHIAVKRGKEVLRLDFKVVRFGVFGRREIADPFAGDSYYSF